jgi:hypothetical protein
LSNIIGNQVQYRILLYVTKTQPVATIRVMQDFKLSVQKSKYVSFYDESRTLWSILFDSEELVSNFGTKIVLCKINMLQGNIESVKSLQQDLRVHENEENPKLEQNDGVEVENIVSIWKDMKLTEVFFFFGFSIPVF